MLRSIAAPRSAHSTLAVFAATLALSGCGGGQGGGGGTGGDGGAGGGGQSLPPPLPVPANVYSHGEPTDLEQALLEETQRARADPAATGKRLVELPEVQGAIESYGVDKAQVIAEFMTYPPVPPLAFDPHLMASALFHSKDMAENGFQEHDGSAGEDLSDRVTAAGYDWGFISENIFAYAKSVAQCNAAFLIDWGNPDLGHRFAILDVEDPVRDIGISIIEAPNGPNDVGPLVVTQDFGQPLKDKRRYIVGVAYRDDNGNGFYDPGEGAAGLFVVPASGDTYAVTSKSGGYAIPMLPDAGTLKVQIQTPTGEVIQEGEVTLAGTNVKLDFALAQ